MSELLEEVSSARANYIEMMAAAYYKVTDIDPHNVELVEEHRGHLIVFYFQPKQVSED